MRLQSPVGSEKTLIIGDSGEASLLAALSRAFEVQDPGGSLDGSTLWVRSLQTARDVSHQTTITRALVDTALLRTGSLAVIDARGIAIPVRPIGEELERRFGRVHTSLTETPEDFSRDLPVPSVLSKVVRRTVEILLSVSVLLVTLPILLAISLVYRAMFGPAVFLRERVTVGKGRELLVLSEYAPTPLVSAKSTWQRTATESIRRNIYRTHLNGVPLLEKVISGELALVGPTTIDEPVFEAIVADHPVFAARTWVRPGLISLSRVRLRTVRTEYDLKKAIEYDLYYIKHRSLWLDARILGRACIILVTDVLVAVVRIVGTAFSLAGGVLRRWMSGGELRAASLAPPPMPAGFGDSEGHVAPTLLIGAGAGASLLVPELQRNRRIGLWPVALVDDDPKLVGTRIRGVPVLGTTAAARAIVERERIQSVVISVPSATPAQMQRLVSIAKSTEADVYSMPGVGQILKGEAPSALVTVPTKDLLGRPVVEIDATRARAFLGGKRVLVTGAVGSIGREVIEQALRGEPAVIFGMDINESDLYDLQQEYRQRELGTEFVPVVGSVCDAAHVARILGSTRPQVVFHAAAYKHVPLMEDFPHEAVRTNIGGTWEMASAAARFGVERFVMVSTDKAVNPSSVMGATKRVAELIVQDIGFTTSLSTCSVRFGNVLGSRGSVIPLFERQIERGGPITITDPGMLRYFMTIPEAAGLIIEAGAFGDRGVVYMLDMGEPVRIVDLATRLIELKGLRPDEDIEIRYTGLRPGEKLFEELSLDFEQARPTEHQKIRILDEGGARRKLSAHELVEEILQLTEHGNAEEIRNGLLERVRAVDNAAYVAA